MALCAISGVVPQEPVVSTKSGHVFEKRLIERHIETTGQCPVTNTELSLRDLLPLQVGKVVKPRPPAATSIPGIIQIMQNEWDALMLESYTLKKHLEDVRQELAHALYQHDAACRVIARLIKERDAARSALGDTQANMAAAVASGAAAASPMEDADAATGITKAIATKMETIAKELSASRKKVVSDRAARVPAKDKIAAFTKQSSAAAGNSALTAVDVRGDAVIAGTQDGSAVVLRRGRVAGTLSGHKKAVTSVKFGAADVAFTASADHTAMIWRAGADGKFAAAATLRDHTAAVVGVTVHNSGAYFVTASADSTWNFYDTASGSLRQSVRDAKVSAPYSRVSFHPDGLILGTGATDGAVRIFDVCGQKQVASFTGHTGSVTDVVFSENGYYLASSDSNGTVKLWDLRKLENLYTVAPVDGVSVVHALDFDASGKYLAAATNKDVRVYTVAKTLDVVHAYNGHTADVTGVRWAPDASSFVSVSSDRNVVTFGL